jgi:hypothetical protein
MNLAPHTATPRCRLPVGLDVNQVFRHPLQSSGEPQLLSRVWPPVPRPPTAAIGLYKVKIENPSLVPVPQVARPNLLPRQPADLFRREVKRRAAQERYHVVNV